MTGEEDRPMPGRDLNTGLRSRGFAEGVREEVRSQKGEVRCGIAVWADLGIDWEGVGGESLGLSRGESWGGSRNGLGQCGYGHHGKQGP